MNMIDKNFLVLVNTIRRESVSDIFQKIQDSYLNIPTSIQDSIEDFFSKFPYWGMLSRKDGVYEELYLRAVSLKEHVEDFVWLYHHLEDYRSKKVLYAILNNWYSFDFNSLASCIERNYSHYFDLDIVGCSKEEVLVDLGAYTGDTILDYFKQYGTDNYKKIYCYEITPSSFNTLKNTLSNYPNIDCRLKAVSDTSGSLSFEESSVDASANKVSESYPDGGEYSVEAVTLDQDIVDKITLLKMDIEGSEERALMGAKQHIIKDHPKLLVSVYHNHEDLWKIPKMIHELWDGYRFHLRYYGNNIFPTEIVLFATD